MDQNLEYQQNLRGASIAIVVLECRSNRFDDPLPLLPRLVEASRRGPLPGSVLRVGS